MTRTRIALLCATLTLPVAIGGWAVQQSSQTAPAMTQAGQEWLATLDDAQRQQATYEYDADERVDWHFIPIPTRKGVAIRDMKPNQRAAARKLLNACLSRAGYTKVREVMSLEALLAKLQAEAGGEGPERDPHKYYFTVFGKCDADSRWGLSIEGHHLSLNFVVEGDEVISSSPTFFAANPTIVNRGFRPQDSPFLTALQRGQRVLADEELIAFELVNSLNEAQLATAMIAETAPAEIRAAGEPQPPQEAAQGIAFGDLDASQQSRLIALVRTYATNLPREVAAKRLNEMRSNLKELKFAWAGATKPGIGHYYRVQGPTLLIEFVNTQPDAEGNPASHIHCVWRDPRGDFALPATTNP